MKQVHIYQIYNNTYNGKYNALFYYVYKFFHILFAWLLLVKK